MDTGDVMDIKTGRIKRNSPEHKHRFYEIIIYTDGTGCFSLNDLSLPVSKGTIIVVPPGMEHGTVSDNGCERIFIHGEFDRDLNLAGPVVIKDNSEQEGLFLAEMIYRNRYKNSRYVAELVNVFIEHILQNIETDDNMNAAVKAVINEINNRFSDCSLNLNAVLKQSGYAEDYIRAKFKESTGKTPVRFLTEMRISYACFLIEVFKKSLSLYDIAEKCGYTDYVYFSRRFKEIMGISPRKYMSDF